MRTTKSASLWALFLGALMVTPMIAQAQQAHPQNSDSASHVATRFRDPAGITGDPTGLRRDTTQHIHPGPRFPFGKVKPGTIGASVVAFVIDTVGRVEPETITFLRSPRSEFRDVVCDYVRTLRFEPFEVGDTKSRVLLVQMYGFDNLFTVDSTIIAARKFAEKSQEEFATHPVSQVVANLEAMPHC